MAFSILSGKLLIRQVNEPADAGAEYERFTLTVNPDATRSLRTLTRSPAGDLLRDTHQTVQATWRPIEGYGRVFFKGDCLGTVLRRVEGDRLFSEYWKPGQAPDRAEFPAPSNLTFGFHPVMADAWKTNFYDIAKGGTQEVYTHTVSNTWNGSTMDHGMAKVSSMDYLGTETVEVPAGKFECDHFMWHTRIDSDLEIWRTGPEHLLVKLGAHHRDTVYELGELDLLEIE